MARVPSVTWSQELAGVVRFWMEKLLGPSWGELHVVVDGDRIRQRCGWPSGPRLGWRFAGEVLLILGLGERPAIAGDEAHRLAPDAPPPAVPSPSEAGTLADYGVPQPRARRRSGPCPLMKSLYWVSIEDKRMDHPHRATAGIEVKAHHKRKAIAAPRRWPGLWSATCRPSTLTTVRMGPDCSSVTLVSLLV